MSNKILKIYEKSLYMLINVLFGSVLIVGCLQVFFRYFIGSSLVWSEEFCRYVFVWLVLLGATAGIPRGVHLSVDLLSRKMGVKLGAILSIITSLFVIGFLITLVWQGAIIVSHNMSQASAAMGLPLGIIFLAIPVCGLLMIFEFGRLILKNLAILKKNGGS